MPKRLLTAKLARELIELAEDNQLQEMKIDKYKSGNNKGRLFVDYKIGEKEAYYSTTGILAMIEKNLEKGRLVDLTARTSEEGEILYEMTAIREAISNEG